MKNKLGRPETPENQSILASDAVSAKSDRLICFREVHALVGSACKTGHTARSLAARGLIRAVRINERVVRYSEHSVLALVAGKVAA